MKARWIIRAATVLASTVAAATLTVPVPALADPTPTPGMEVDDDSGRCTAGFAADDANGNHYLLTSGHCDAHDGSLWTYGDDIPLGYITASEREGDVRDAAIIKLNPEVGAPDGDLNGAYPVRDVLSAGQLQVGMPFCKTGAVSGETCGAITSIDGNVVETSVFSLEGDSGSPGFVKNPDGTVSAVGLLMSSPEGDDNTTYFALVAPLLNQWGLSIVG
ncbi:S1 family peptidase [Mycolicibacterium komossense]|uniref:S1 family peptidase n=1 Tax=Mycolicibacterium komossense TaxID=1779 RepID=UPI003F4941D7